jgi:hypothetical protein
MADGFTQRKPAPPEKIPLFRPLPEAPPFPTDALCALRDAAEAVQLRTQAPAGLCAQSVLAAATLAACAGNDVELPGAGRRPLVGLFATIAESGERKTSADRIALAPIYKIEDGWRRDHDAQMQRHRDDADAYKRAREHATKAAKGDRAAIRAALGKLGPEPTPPPSPMLLIADPTPEAIVKHLETGRSWGGLFTSEGGVFVGGHSFSDDAKMRTAGLLNILWDGDAIRRARVLTGNSFLPGRRLTAHVMMQMTVAETLLGDAMLDGIGTLARLLIVAPGSTAGTRMFRETPPECSVILDAYGERLTALVNRPLRFRGGTRDALDPLPLRMSHDARQVWIMFHDYAERELAADGKLAAIRAWGAKAAEHAARLAGVLTVYGDPEAQEVGVQDMKAATHLAQHYAAEMLRLAGSSAIDPELRLAARVLEWWRTQPPVILAVRDAATVRRIMTILANHGHAIPLKDVLIDGVKRREAWGRAE